MHETVGAHSYTHSGRISEVYRVPEIIIGLSETTGGRRPRYPQRSVATHSFEHRPAAREPYATTGGRPEGSAAAPCLDPRPPQRDMTELARTRGEGWIDYK